jgi:hypothetical protein
VDLTETGILRSGSWDPVTVQAMIYKSRLIDNELQRKLNQVPHNPDALGTTPTTELPQYGTAGYIYRTAAGSFSLANPTASGLAVTTWWENRIVSDATASAARTGLGVAIGSDVQAYDPNLTLVAATDPSAGDVFYWPSSTTGGKFNTTSFGRTFAGVADANHARSNLELPFISVKDHPYEAKGNGTTNDTTAIGNAEAAADDTGGILYFPPGTYSVTALTTSANVVCKFAPGAMLAESGAATITFGGPVEAGDWQIFSGFESGDIVMTYNTGNVAEINPQWWGAKPTAAEAVNVAAINSSLAALTSGARWRLPSGYYNTDAVVGYSGSDILYARLTFDGIINNTGGTDVLSLEDIYNSNIEGIKVYGTGANPPTGSGVLMGDMTDNNIDIRYVYGCNAAIDLTQASDEAFGHNTVAVGQLVGNKYGFWISTTTGSGDSWVSDNLFVGTHAESAVANGWVIYYDETRDGDACYNNRWLGLYIDGYANGFYLYGAYSVYLDVAGGEGVTGTWFETPGTDGVNIHWGGGNFDSMMADADVVLGTSLKGMTMQTYSPTGAVKNIVMDTSVGGLTLVDQRDTNGMVNAKDHLYANNVSYQSWLTYSYLRPNYLNYLDNGFKDSAAPTTGTWPANAIVWNTDTSDGQALGWVCTAYGTMDTLAGVTCDTTKDSAVIVVNDASDLRIGQKITVGGGVSSLTNRTVEGIDGTNITVSGAAETANPGVNDAAVSFVAATWKAMPNYGAVSTTSGDSFTFTDEDASPNAAGMLKYDNTVAGFEDGLLAWYDDDEVRYVVDLDTLPGDAEDDYVVAYDKDADKFYMKQDATAGVDTTAVDNTTWSDGANASNVWTFNVSGTDTTMTFGSGLVTFSHDIEVDGSDISIGAAGVKLTGDGDGAITLLGLGNGFDEDLSLNLDDVENTGTFTSSTGLATLNFSGIALQESGVGVISNDEMDASSELAAIMDDETGTAGALVFSDSPTFTDDITVAAAGVLMTGSNGSLTILGKGDGQDEDIKLDLNTTANTLTVTSPTSSLDKIDATGMTITATGFAGDLTGDVTGNADTATTASAGDAAENFFGAGVSAVTDGTVCTDLEGVGLAIDTATLKFVSTEVEATTWGAGGNASNIWSFNLSGTDTTLTLGSALFTFSHAVTSGGTITSSGTFDVTGATGMILGSADVTGLTITTDGTGNGELTLPNDSIGDADIDWGSGAGQVDLADILGGVAPASAFDFGGATLEIPNSADPDLTVTGQVSMDTDGANVTGDVSIRGFDGTNQFKVAGKLKWIQATIIKPNDLADATRDKCIIWSNESGMTFTVAEIKAWSDTDDTDLNVEEYDADGAANNATVDAIQCTTGAGPYTDDETTITGATIEAGHVIAIDFDDTDDPGYVKISIGGWYDANVD